MTDLNFLVISFFLQFVFLLFFSNYCFILNYLCVPLTMMNHKESPFTLSLICLLSLFSDGDTFGIISIVNIWLRAYAIFHLRFSIKDNEILVFFYLFFSRFFLFSIKARRNFFKLFFSMLSRWNMISK